MNADEARRITRENLRGPVIEPLLRIAHVRIKEAAKAGNSSITHPFLGADHLTTGASREAALLALSNEGYTVKHHDDPDLGHPCSHEYDSVSW